MIILSTMLLGALAVPQPTQSNLSLQLQHLVRNQPSTDYQARFTENGWGSPLLEPTAQLPNRSNDKGVRTAFNGDASSLESSNFVIWYGQPDGFSLRDVEALSAEMEHIWEVIIDDMAYPQPENADRWKFNVYIGDTGGGVPSAEGNAGYFWYDSENYPMIVLSKEIISWTDSAKLTGAHGFYHAVQAAVNTYTLNNTALWWHEATANWILEEVYRNDGGYSNTLYSVALRPEIALNHWGDYATEGIGGRPPLWCLHLRHLSL